MTTVVIRCVLFFVLSFYVFGDEIEMEVHSGNVLKMLREMVNQTAAESLNLPANATSIRENITDTFSCENRTYGYYADVDNECQIFHVCYPSQMPSGRNVTYRWSFICPQETVFNQEVLVCTRVIDSIPCEESPNYYDLNMEIGKIAEPETNKEQAEIETNKEQAEIETNKEQAEIETNKKETEQVPVNKEIRKPNRKRQNIIMEALMKEADEQMEVMEEMLEGEKAEESVVEFNEELKPNEEKEQPQLMEVEKVMEVEKPMEVVSEIDENSRLGSERSLRRRGRKINRGSMKYRGDA